MKEIKGYTPKGKEKVMEFFNVSGDKLRALKMLWDENRPNLSLSDCKNILQVWVMELNQDSSRKLYEENKRLSEQVKELHLNMQYYMEFCQTNGYITPMEWLEKHKQF